MQRAAQVKKGNLFDGTTLKNDTFHLQENF